jgi:hypothetical protein
MAGKAEIKSPPSRLLMAGLGPKISPARLIHFVVCRRCARGLNRREALKAIRPALTNCMTL